MTPEEKTERRLVRKTAAENARRVEDAPLLAHAGLVELTNVEEQRQRKARHKAQALASWEEMRASGIEHLRRACEIRTRLQRLVGYREILAADAWAARVFGADGTFILEFWREREVRLERGEALLDEYIAWTDAQREASRRSVRDLLSIWAQVEAAHPDLAAAAVGPPSSTQRKAVRTLGELREEAVARLCPRSAP